MTRSLSGPRQISVRPRAGCPDTQPTASARPDRLDATAAPAATRAGTPGWMRGYVSALVAGDAGCAVLAIVLAWFVRRSAWSQLSLSVYLIISAIVVAGWLACLKAVGGYDLRSVATATQELRLVARGALFLGGAVATSCYLSHVLVARSFIAILVPVGALLQLLARYAVRRFAYAQRARGGWTRTIVAVGTSESVGCLVEATSRNRFAGLRVVAACVEDAERDTELAPGVPVLGGVTQVAAVAELIDADIVAVAGAGLGPRRIRELGWALEGTGRQMVMAPGLSEVAGPRVHVSPVEGLPLVWVDQPQFSGSTRLAKRVMDVGGAALLLLLSAPFLLLLGLLVRLTSAGPALYLSERMGLNGELIKVFKFRSMYTDAEQRLSGLLEVNECEGGVLFKMRADPRVTRVGRFLRKYSLDELPQLINVLNGTMSLVGPRPPLPNEVEKYQNHVHRRLLVKPGMTGLWQVSGRSDLCWDESVRLDLFYVENWSLGLDLAITCRTVWAVLRGRGAY